MKNLHGIKGLKRVMSAACQQAGTRTLGAHGAQQVLPLSQATQLVEMQRAIYQLIESQTRIAMPADDREDYVFHTIDPAFVLEQPVGSLRSIIVIIGTLPGVIFSIAFALMDSAVKESQNSSKA
ncbi:MAG: hypothetical protein RLZZ385_1635 [Pseudomonadota bacterium]